MFVSYYTVYYMILLYDLLRSILEPFLRVAENVCPEVLNGLLVLLICQLTQVCNFWHDDLSAAEKVTHWVLGLICDFLFDLKFLFACACVLVHACACVHTQYVPMNTEVDTVSLSFVLRLLRLCSLADAREYQ